MCIHQCVRSRRRRSTRSGGGHVEPPALPCERCVRGREAGCIIASERRSHRPGEGRVGSLSRVALSSHHGYALGRHCCHRQTMATDSHVSYLSARSIQLWRSCTRRRRRRIHLWWRRACSSCASIRCGARGRCVWRRGACGFWCRTTRSRSENSEATPRPHSENAARSSAAEPGGTRTFSWTWSTPPGVRRVTLPSERAARGM